MAGNSVELSWCGVSPLFDGYCMLPFFFALFMWFIVHQRVAVIVELFCSLCSFREIGVLKKASLFVLWSV